MWYGAFVVACIALFVIPIFLVFHDDYDDGVIGRIALLGMAFCAALFLLEVFFGSGYHIEREESGLMGAMALFLTWHSRRFCGRIAAERQRRSACAPTAS